ncbi:MAG: hypothetical protein Q8Q49_06280 [bacterium]|nr:hypothetical protein [bacterium]
MRVPSRLSIPYIIRNYQEKFPFSAFPTRNRKQDEKKADAILGKTMYLSHLITSLLAFVGMWIGAGLIIKATDSFSQRLRLSSFAFSFFVLGMFTSTPEFALGMTALAEKNPEIFIGDLIGGIPVLFLLAIPLLAILGNGINLHAQLRDRNLLIAFVVMLAPTFFVMDRVITSVEAIVMLGLYGLLFVLIEREHGLLDTSNGALFRIRQYSLLEIIKVVIGIGIVFVASHLIVEDTLFFADAFSLSAFTVSIVVLSLGTNLPELSLAIRSVLAGKKDIAFGDYVGSAAANTFLFGIFTLLSDGASVTVKNFFGTFLIVSVGLALFFFFARSGRKVTRREGICLLGLYVVFIIIEGWGKI